MHDMRHGPRVPLHVVHWQHVLPAHLLVLPLVHHTRRSCAPHIAGIAHCAHWHLVLSACGGSLLLKPCRGCGH